MRHAKPRPSLASPTPAPVAATSNEALEMPTFTIVNTNYFGVALRQHPDFDHATQKTIEEMVKGGLAVLSFPDLNPPQLDAVLKVLARTIPLRKPKTQAEIDAEKKEAEESYVPGRRPKGPAPPSVPELLVVGALIEGRAYETERLKEVAKLPTLDMLRAQIVGLLSAPGSQIAAVLNEASGGKLARTLEGFKKSLEDAQGGGSSDAPPS
jgi:ribosomal protein L10